MLAVRLQSTPFVCGLTIMVPTLFLCALAVRMIHPLTSMCCLTSRYPLIFLSGTSARLLPIYAPVPRLNPCITWP